MSVSGAVSSWEAKLKLESHVDSSGTDYVELADVINIDGPNMTKSAIDVTHLNSTNRWQQFINGMRSGGTCNFTLNFIYAEYLKLKNQFDSDDNLAGFQILLPNSAATTITFDAVINSLGTGIPFNDRITTTCSLTASGAVAVV